MFLLIKEFIGPLHWFHNINSGFMIDPIPISLIYIILYYFIFQ